jgi:hypothetical protein
MLQAGASSHVWEQRGRKKERKKEKAYLQFIDNVSTSEYMPWNDWTTVRSKGKDLE